MNLEIIKHLTQFGVAGLMGFLWVFERFVTRQYMRQLSDTHIRITGQREKLSILIGLVHKNTQALERFDQTQRQLKEILKEINRKIRLSK